MKITTKLLEALIEQLGGEVELTVSNELLCKDGAWSRIKKSLVWTIKDVSPDRPLWHMYGTPASDLYDGVYISREEKIKEALCSRGHKSMSWTTSGGLRVWNDPA
jgi:hypothetical protein